MTYPDDPEWMRHDWTSAGEDDFLVADKRLALDEAIQSRPHSALRLVNDESTDIHQIYRERTFLECAAYYKRLSVV